MSDSNPNIVNQLPDPFVMFAPHPILEPGLIERLADALDVQPSVDPPVIGIKGLDGNTYSWLEIVEAHVLLIKSATEKK